MTGGSAASVQSLLPDVLRALERKARGQRLDFIVPASPLAMRLLQTLRRCVSGVSPLDAAPLLSIEAIACLSPTGLQGKRVLYFDVARSPEIPDLELGIVMGADADVARLSVFSTIGIEPDEGDVIYAYLHPDDVATHIEELKADLRASSYCLSAPCQPVIRLTTRTSAGEMSDALRCLGPTFSIPSSFSRRGRDIAIYLDNTQVVSAGSPGSSGAFSGGLRFLIRDRVAWLVPTAFASAPFHTTHESPNVGTQGDLASLQEFGIAAAMAGVTAARRALAELRRREPSVVLHVELDLTNLIPVWSMSAPDRLRSLAQTFYGESAEAAWQSTSGGDESSDDHSPVKVGKDLLLTRLRAIEADSQSPVRASQPHGATVDFLLSTRPPLMATTRTDRRRALDVLIGDGLIEVVHDRASTPNGEAGWLHKVALSHRDTVPVPPTSYV